MSRMRLSKRAKEVISGALRGFLTISKNQFKRLKLSNNVQLVVPLPLKEVTKFEQTFNASNDPETLTVYSGSTPVEKWEYSYDASKNLTKVEKV